MLVGHLDGVALDCNASLPLKIHVVENLVLEIARINGPCHLKESVGKSALAMVYMCDYAEVTYVVHQPV
jgi:hypothetical protein